MWPETLLQWFYKKKKRLNKLIYNKQTYLFSGGNRKEQKYAAQKQSIHNFIQRLSCVESHYCRKTKSAERKYLSSYLNINKLYKIYKESEYSNGAVKKSYFRHIFNSSYNLGFGTPKTDACSTCLELNSKIASENDPQKKASLMTEKRVHSLRAKAFYEKLNEVMDGLKIMSFDCQKNLPLPKVPDQMAYYSRQLYFFNFTVVEGASSAPLIKERVFTYYCMENEFNKDSNLVASAVTHRLNNTDLSNITNIRLIADGCGGQNKNSIVVGACSKWLLEHQNIKAIELVFPVTGHSFMPADRQFGIVEKKLRKMDVILHPDMIKDVLGETSTLVKLGDDCPIFNWRDAVKTVLKPTTSWNMAFKECKRFILRRSKVPGNVLIRGELFYKSDTAKAQNVCLRNKNIRDIMPQQLPNIVPVNKNKLADVKKLLQKHFGPEWTEISLLSFYVNIFDAQESLAEPEVPEERCTEIMDESQDLRV